MPTANAIITPQTVNGATATCSTANTTYSDSPTNTVAIITASAGGSRIVRLTAIPRATVTATMLQLYRSFDAGATKKLFNTKLMAAHTVAATTAIPVTDFGYSEDNPLLMKPGEIIYCAIGVDLGAGIMFSTEYLDY